MRKIIAVDFDNTLCVTTEYPKIDGPILEVVEALKCQKDLGAYIILWTCREGEHLAQALKWCEEQGIVLDNVNANCPDAIAEYRGNDCRKIYAHEYWDDKAVVLPRFIFSEKGHGYSVQYSPTS